MKKKKSGTFSTFVLLIFISLFCVSSYKVSSQLIVDYRQNKTFNALIEQVNQARAGADASTQGVVAAGDAAVLDEGAAVQGSGSAAAGNAAAAQGDGSGAGNAAAQGDGPGAGNAAAAQGGDANQLELDFNSPGGDSSAQGDGAASGQSGTNGATKLNMLAAYAALHEQNPDLFGWIEIEGTVVNYPVMHTPKDPEFYLHRAFDGSEAYSGVPFLDANCFLGCGNYIVYGHNMKNKTMFKTITYYEDEAFWKEHPVIRFDTLYDAGIYDVVAAFYAQVYKTPTKGAFLYYQYPDLRGDQAFTDYVRQVKSVALYDTGIELKYGDQLLTLSTCEYHKTDGRFVVVAKKRK